ncbi:hypothetical protein LSAT2_000854, partial [Lamellibrachia satsuma]
VQLKRVDFVMPDDESRTNYRVREAHFTESQTDRLMMTDAATQYFLSDFCVTNSTPVNGVAPPLPAPLLAFTEDNYEILINLPHPPSPPPSPVPSPDKGNEYKPSALECLGAAEEEDVSTDDE